MAADTKPPETSFAADDSFIAMVFARGSRTTPELAGIVVTFWIAWKPRKLATESAASLPDDQNECVPDGSVRSALPPKERARPLASKLDPGVLPYVGDGGPKRISSKRLPAAETPARPRGSRLFAGGFTFPCHRIRCRADRNGFSLLKNRMIRNGSVFCNFRSCLAASRS